MTLMEVLGPHTGETDNNNENEKTDELGDGQSTPKGTSDPNYLLENFKKDPDHPSDDDAPLQIGQPESNNDFQFFDDQGNLIVAAGKRQNSGIMTTFGRNLGKESGSNTSIHSQLSVDSTTPRCAARKKCGSATARTPVWQMSAETVQILSDPQLLKAIEIFQGSRTPEEGDVEMLEYYGHFVNSTESKYSHRRKIRNLVLKLSFQTLLLHQMVCRYLSSLHQE